MDHLAARFFLAENDELAALAAMQAFVAQTPAAVFDTGAVRGATDMLTALAAAGLACTRDGDGNVASMRWTGQRLASDFDTLRLLLKSFTRFVKKGSYLALAENGDRWLFAFQKATVKLEENEEVDSRAHSMFDEAERLFQRGKLDAALPLYEQVSALAFADKRRYELAWSRRLWILSEHQRWSEIVALSAVGPEDERDFPTRTLVELDGEDDAAFDALLEVILAADPTNERALEYRRERHPR